MAAISIDDIVEMLEETNLPLAYDHFAEGDSPDPPFLVYRFPNDDPIGADNEVYVRPVELDVELYTDRKDPAVEKRVTDVLDSHQMFYQSSETWIDSEKMYEVLYAMEVLLE